uniref:GTP_EFTU_D3 domain-containing protein n=1 Tax=Caenorhabditis japonica TaxID=281687 RepID=A0A8R1EHE9_CAEJA
MTAKSTVSLATTFFSHFKALLSRNLCKLAPSSFLAKGTSAVVEVETEHDIAVEPFTSCRPLGRVTFRSAGQTIAAGIVEAVITPQ